MLYYRIHIAKLTATIKLYKILKPTNIEIEATEVIGSINFRTIFSNDINYYYQVLPDV